MGRASGRRKAKRQVWLHTRRVTARLCPACLAVLDGATSLSLDTPGAPWTEMPEGSATLCAYCGAILIVVGKGFRVATDAEFAELEPLQRRLLAEAPLLGPRAQKTRVS